MLLNNDIGQTQIVQNFQASSQLCVLRQEDT